MQLKLISYSENDDIFNNASHGMIKTIIGADDCDYEFCKTRKEAFDKLREGFTDADTIVLVVDISVFISTKAYLFKALGLNYKINNDITSIIESDACIATLNEKQIKAHAAIPSTGIPFITSDGLFSGFGVKAGKQKLIMLPIDERRISHIPDNELTEFLEIDNSKKDEEIIIEAETVPEDSSPEIQYDISDEENTVSEDTEIIIENTETENTETEDTEISEEPVEDLEKNEEEILTEETEENDIEETSYEDINSSSYNDNVSEKTVEEKETDVYGSCVYAARMKNIKICFAIQENSPVSEHINKTVLPSDNDILFIKNISLDNTATEDIRRKEATASCARKAITDTSAFFGIAVSDIFYDENNLAYIFAAIADTKKSSVFKIIALEDESTEHFIKTSVESLLEKLTESIEEIEESDLNSGISSADIKSKNNSGPSIGTKVIIWALIVIALCFLSALIIDTVMTKNNSPASFISSNELVNYIQNLYFNL